MELPHWCPPGYVPVNLILHAIIDCRQQGATFKNLPDFDTMSARRFQTRLGRALAYGELLANGVLVPDGGLVCVPPGAWLIRASHPHVSHRDTDQFDLALTGDPIFITSPSGEQCRPIVRQLDLAVWAGLSLELEPLEIKPEDKTGADAARPGSHVEQPAAPPPAPWHRASGGRPSPHDWDAFWMEAVHWVAENVETTALEKQYRRPLQKYMLQWSAGRVGSHDKPMDETTVSRALARLFKHRPV